MGNLEIVFLGIGLATDASCICTSNGLVYKPRLYNTLKMAFVYALFQFIMPVIGFLGASLLPKAIDRYNHRIAFVLLGYIGVKMIWDAYKDSYEEHEVCPSLRESNITNRILMLQGVATSIDALSVGFAFSGMLFIEVINASMMIAMVTFIMCFSFVKVGIFIGDKINTKAEFVGGSVLILLGFKLLIDAF